MHIHEEKLTTGLGIKARRLCVCASAHASSYVCVYIYVHIRMCVYIYIYIRTPEEDKRTTGLGIKARRLSVCASAHASSSMPASLSTSCFPTGHVAHPVYDFVANVPEEHCETRALMMHTTIYTLIVCRYGA